MLADNLEWMKHFFLNDISDLLVLVLVIVHFLYVRSYRHLSEKNDREHSDKIQNLQFEIGRLQGAIKGETTQIQISSEKGSEENMEPITALSVFGSLASIATLLQSRGETVTEQRIRDYAADQLAKEQGVKKLAKEDTVAVTELAGVFIRLHSADDKILDRIMRKCLTPLDSAYDDDNMDNDDLFEIREIARRCVCQLLKHVEMDNSGGLPSKEFKVLSKRFSCGMLK